MTAPVDVLAVMDRLLAVANDDVQDHDEVTAIYAQGVEARAAIAELIEHNAVMRAALSACPCFCQDEDEDGDAATCDRCAALARVGG